MANMTNRIALNMALVALMSEDVQQMEMADAHGLTDTYEVKDALSTLTKMLEQMDKRNAKHAEYAANARAKKNDQYAEDYVKVVAAFDRIGEPTTLTDAIRMDSDMHANMTTQKLVQVIKHGDGTLVKAKVKGKMLYGRREWFPEGVKIVGEEE